MTSFITHKHSRPPLAIAYLVGLQRFSKSYPSFVIFTALSKDIIGHGILRIP